MKIMIGRVGGSFRQVWTYFRTKLELSLVSAGMDRTLKEYTHNFLIPSVLVGGSISVVLFVLASLIVQFRFSFILRLAPILILGLSLGIPFLIPLLRSRTRATRINQELPFLITYMGGLSTSMVSRDELFSYAAKREVEFGEAAKELQRVRVLAIHWNLGYVTATKVVSTTTPSVHFSDFLARFSQALNTGEPLAEFFSKEQKAILDTYVADYKRSLQAMETLNDTYVAILITMTFIAVTVVTLSSLFSSGEGNAGFLLVLAFAIVTVCFSVAMAYNGVLTKDRLIIRHSEFKGPRLSYKINLICLGVITPIVISGYLIILLREFNTSLSTGELDYMPILVTLMLSLGCVFYPVGKVAGREESRIVRRDTNFPVFIRTLGGAADALGGSLNDAIEILRTQHLGALTDHVHLLYAQSKFGIDSKITWNYFASTTGSMLIQIFTKLYTEAVKIGGSPVGISRFVSDNVERILELRKDRDQLISAFKGAIEPLIYTMFGLMIFMEATLTMLNSTMAEMSEMASGMGGVAILGKPVNPIVSALFFLILYLSLPVCTALALTFPKQGKMASLFSHLARFYIIGGIEIFIVGTLATNMLSSFMGSMPTG